MAFESRAALALAGLAWLGTAALAQDLEAAAAQFVKSCGTCHAVEMDAPARQGPNLHGVFGRKAASVEGFKYSPALKAAAEGGLVWTAETLDPWIENSQKLVPGNIMPYRQRDAEKRKLVVEYLKTLPHDAAAAAAN